MLTIIQYPHPTLRRVAKPLRRVDVELQRIVREMFDRMYSVKGIGLAATQVDLPYRLFVANPESDPSNPELEFVFINPVLSKPKGQTEAEEGCLSLPGLYGDVNRPEKITIEAYNLTGQPVTLELGGLMARIVQHENDHLDGVLFIDRLTPTGQVSAREALSDFEAIFEGQRRRGEIPSDAEIAARWDELERQRC